MLNSKMIGAKITEARKKNKISQAQLAEQLFISPQAVGKWERGESMPDIIMLNRLAEMLGVDFNYFSENFQSVVIETKNESFNQAADEFKIEKEKNRLNWDMSKGNWANADFSGLKNLHEKFNSSNMQRCLFKNSDLSGLILKNNNVESCDFSNSDFTKSRIKYSNLSNNKYVGCLLKETEFSGSYIYGCDFSNVDFTGVTIKSGGFDKNMLENAVWKQTSFINTHLINMIFDGILEDCYFENCSFKKITFRNSTLRNTFFKHNKNLKRIQFVDCKADRLTYEFLKAGNADLNGITLITD